MRAFAKDYYKQKKDLLLIHASGLCVKYPKSQRALHGRPRINMMAQLYQHEILFKLTMPGIPGLVYEKGQGKT